MPARLRALARALRHTPDRLFHGSRRRRAERRLTESRPRRLLVLCLGNICRSPYAAGVLARELPDHEIRSAGFLESGRPPPRNATSVAAERGVNLTGHASTRLTPELMDWADLVLVMDQVQARRARNMAPSETAWVAMLGDFDPKSIDTRVIIDPIERDRQFFDRVYARIDACCATVTKAAEHRGTTGSRSAQRLR